MSGNERKAVAMKCTSPSVSNGDYAVVINENGCADTSICSNVTIVGVDENGFGNNLVLYPNPTDGNFSIHLEGNRGATTITITDLAGKTISSETYGELQFLNLNIEEPAGIYLFEVKSGNKRAVIRLIKK